MLNTARLCLCQWRDTDLPPFAAVNADRPVMEHFPKTLDRVESDAMAGRIRQRIEETGYGLWAVEVAGGPPFIGFVGLATPRFEAHFTPCMEIGWRLAYAHWGQGYATEAAIAALEFAFRRLKLEAVVSFTTHTNRRSRRVMERLGMTRDPADDFAHPHVPEGSPQRPHVLYRLRRAGWELALTR